MAAGARDGDITVDLDGERGIDPRAVADAIVAVEKLVASLSDDDSPRLELAELSTGSAHVSVRSPSSESVVILRDGLRQLHGSAALPDGWGRGALAAVVDLGKVSSKRGVEGVRVSIDSMVERIDGVIQANAEKALAAEYRSLGSVRGVLYRYTNDVAKSRRSAGLRDVHTHETVELLFDRNTADRMKAYLEMQVEVWGEVERDTGGRAIKVTVEGIVPVDPIEPASAEDGRGLLGPDWTDGADPVDWVRGQRD